MMMLILFYIVTQKNETIALLKLAESTYVSNIFTNQNNWIILGILESLNCHSWVGIISSRFTLGTNFYSNWTIFAALGVFIYSLQLFIFFLPVKLSALE